MNRMIKYQNPVSTLVNEVFDNFWSPFGNFKGSYVQESIDRDDQGYTVRLALAGVPHNELNVEYQDGILKVLRGENYLRSYRLPEAVDVDNISAETKDGILSIRVPAKAPPIIKIEVKKG